MRSLIALLTFVPLAACTYGGFKPSPTAPASAPASSPAPVDRSAARAPHRNERVRVLFSATATQPQRFLSGRLVRLSADTVFLTRGLGLQVDTVVLGAERQLQVVVRSRTQARAGAMYGLLAGALAGGIVGAATYQPCTETGFAACIAATTQGENMAGGALLGGVLGAVIGSAIGSGMRTEEWGTVDFGGHVISVRPTEVGVRIAF